MALMLSQQVSVGWRGLRGGCGNVPPAARQRAAYSSWRRMRCLRRPLHANEWRPVRTSQEGAALTHRFHFHGSPRLRTPCRPGSDEGQHRHRWNRP